METKSGHCPGGPPARVGRADRLRPASAVMAGLGTTGVAVMLVLGMAMDVDLSRWLWRVTVAMSGLSVVLGLWRLWLCLFAPRPAGRLLNDNALPRYTVILPLFREAHMVQPLIRSLSALDYPVDKLDIVLACEAVDTETVFAARRQARPPFRVMVVPPVEPGGEPQTKPRALNHVLARSDSELVTIYDAEDRPTPGQLRAAASAFADHPDWTALQAPLDYFNTRDGWLAAQFGLEYSGLFHVMLPAFDRLGLPFPLGGTSNHMRRDALQAVGGWDPYNVTEDADLSFRLAAWGGRIGWIAPPTQEEACYRLRPWFRQRSRWIKGYLQTWLVHMNAPLSGGWRRAVMLQMTLGISLLSIAFYAPVMAVLALWSLASATGVVEAGLPLLYLGALGFSLLCGMTVGALGAHRSGQRHLMRAVPFMPLYWLLLFPPFLRALWELRTDPFHWHKTEHGVTGARPDSEAHPTTQADDPNPWTPTPT